MQPTSPVLEVTLAHPASAEETTDATAFGLRVAPRNEDGWQFVCEAGRRWLCSPRAEGPMRLEVCASGGELARRLRTARSTDPLARAVGLGRGRQPPTILDATAGLCRDAMVLANLGCSVQAVERIPALALWSHWNVQAAGLEDRLRITLADATTWLAASEPGGFAPDVVCLDPMFDRPGKAQVKKEMQVCRRLAGPSGSTAELVAAARRAAADRVVIKRHPDLPPLADDVSFTIESGRIRFDVYLTARATPSAVNAARRST